MKNRTLHVLESFTRSNPEFNESILIGCFFQECQIGVNSTELWYCTFEDSWINLEGFRNLWKEIWSNDFNKLAQFLYVYENLGSGLRLVETVLQYVKLTEEQIKSLKVWEPLFATCEGRVNCCHPKRLIHAESTAMTESLVMSERCNFTGEDGIYEDCDYDDD